MEQKGIHATSAPVVAPAGEMQLHVLPPVRRSITRRPSTRTRIAVGVATVAFVVLNALVVLDLVATNSTSADVKAAQTTANAELAEARQQLAMLRTQVTSATAQLARHTKSRDTLRRNDATTRKAAAETAADVRTAAREGEGPTGSSRAAHGLPHAFAGRDECRLQWRRRRGDPRPRRHRSRMSRSDDMTRRTIIAIALVAVVLVAGESLLGAQVVQAHHDVDAQQRALARTRDDVDGTDAATAARKTALAKTNRDIATRAARRSRCLWRTCEGEECARLGRSAAGGRQRAIGRGRRRGGELARVPRRHEQRNLGAQGRERCSRDRPSAWRGKHSAKRASPTVIPMRQCSRSTSPTRRSCGSAMRTTPIRRTDHLGTCK